MAIITARPIEILKAKTTQECDIGRGVSGRRGRGEVSGTVKEERQEEINNERRAGRCKDRINVKKFGL